MTDLTDLQQIVHQAWADACQARHYAREARLRATRTTQEVQRASHRVRMTCLALSMPRANSLTLALTVTILASRGLLDEKPTLRPSAAVAPRSAKPTRPATRRRR
jgi:hypothetical protein